MHWDSVTIIMFIIVNIRLIFLSTENSSSTAHLKASLSDITFISSCLLKTVCFTAQFQAIPVPGKLKQ